MKELTSFSLVSIKFCRKTERVVNSRKGCRCGLAVKAPHSYAFRKMRRNVGIGSSNLPTGIKLNKTSYYRTIKDGAHKAASTDACGCCPTGNKIEQFCFLRKKTKQRMFFKNKETFPKWFFL